MATSDLEPFAHVGALLDAEAEHAGRSAFNHLLGIARSNGIGRGRVGEVLSMTGLEAVAHRRAGGFSLGMKQRLGIAAAVLGDLAVLIFDEPVNGLDPDGIRWIRGLLRSLAGEGRTVLAATAVKTHHLDRVHFDPVLVSFQGLVIAPNSSAGDYVLWWAGQALISTRPHEAHYPSIATSLVVCLAYAAAALTAAALLVTRRDA